MVCCQFSQSLFVITKAIGAPIVVESRDYFPVTAPALIMVGVLMARIVVNPDWVGLIDFQTRYPSTS